MKYTHEECEKLEGREVEFYDHENDKNHTTIKVGGCDPDVGISIGTKTKDFVCLNGPSSPDPGSHSRYYAKMFEEIVKMIKAKKIYSVSILRMYYGYEASNAEPDDLERAVLCGGSMAECAFK